MSIRVEKQEHVWTIIHDRIEARNSMDPQSADDLVAAFLAFERDPEARVAVLWGAGGAFCAGWDLKYAATLVDLPEQERDEIFAQLDFPKDDGPVPRGAMGPTRLQLSKPVIAAVEGPAVAGGMELAMWCDIRVCAEDAYFGVYCRRWGVPLVDGGTLRLPRLVGQGRALEIILTGRQVPAEEALRIGLCEQIVAPGQARATAESMAHDIARFPQEAVRADRRNVYATQGLGEQEALKVEWGNGVNALVEGIAGAARFSSGHGRHGDFGKI
ncbi:MAG: crotonase/enoyl-CoA hydratase family protein [Proteobacteria bacterium]|nr:crotonase/enoyl-CoA hydratase family protein [Pseudomonadota bacterium]